MTATISDPVAEMLHDVGEAMPNLPTADELAGPVVRPCSPSTT